MNGIVSSRKKSSKFIEREVVGKGQEGSSIVVDIIRENNNGNSTLLDSMETLGLDPIDTIGHIMGGVSSVGVADALISNMVSVDSTNLDAVGGIRGAEMTVKYAILNANVIRSAKGFPAIGVVSDFTKANRSALGTQWEVYTQSAVVVDGKGDIPDGDEITTENVFTEITSLARRKRERVEAGTLDYTFDVKIKSTDTENYQIRKGHTTVDIGSISFSDSQVSSKQSFWSQTKMVSDADNITFKVDYTAGIVSLTLSSADAMEEGTAIVYCSSLDSAKLSDSRSLLSTEIDSSTYLPQIVNTGVKESLVDIEETRANLGMGLLPTSLEACAGKIEAELLGVACTEIPFIAEEYSRIDISEDTSLMKVDKYRLVINEINKCSAQIAKETGIAGAGRVLLLGGSFLYDLFNLSSNTSSVQANSNDDNAFVKIGDTVGVFETYYYPKYDEENPIEEEYENFTVIGLPIDERKSVFLTGVVIPIKPLIDRVVDTDLHSITPITGQLINSLNKDPKSRKLAKKIFVKH